MPTIDEINKTLLGYMTSNTENYSHLLLSYKDNLTQEYLKSLREIENQLAKLYAKVGNAEPNLVDWNKGNRLDSMLNNIKKELNSLGVRETSLHTQGIKNSFQSGYYASSFAMEGTFAVNMGFSVLNKNAIQASLVNPLTKIKWEDSVKTNMATVNKQITSEITQGIIQGKSYQQVAKGISERLIEIKSLKEIYGGVTKSFLIAATEMHRAYNLGANTSWLEATQSAKNLGIKTRKKWMATLDERTRDTHQWADGQFADEKGNFHLFGAEFPAPGNSGIPSEDIRCRCSFITEVEGLKHKKRIDNISKKRIPTTDYCSWYRQRFGTTASGCGKPKLKPKVKKINPSNSTEKTKPELPKLTEKQFNANEKKYSSTPAYMPSGGAKLEANKEMMLTRHGITSNEFDVVNAYSNTGYKVLNNKLSKGTKLNVADAAFKENLEYVLNKLPANSRPVLRLAERVTTDLTKKNIQVGNTVEWDSFITGGQTGGSYASNAVLAPDKFYKFYIKSRTGRLINEFTANRFELEVLFTPNTKFFIERIEGTTIYMTEVI